MHLPSHIDPNDRSPDACRERAYHAQQMMELSDGKGFRPIPEHSSDMSIVERHLYEAGDMELMPKVPGDRRYRQVRRPKDARQQRREAVAKREAKALEPFRNRGQSLEPNDALVQQAIDAFKAKSPVELVIKLATHMGFASLDAFDKACRRAERFMKLRPERGRVPNHIRDRWALKRLTELAIERQFGAKTA